VTLLRLAVRIGMTLADRSRRIAWRYMPWPLQSVRGIVLTPERRVVLVRHSYSPGWHCPAGGIGRNESADTAIRRELREEIGLYHGLFEDVETVSDREEGRSRRLVTFVVREALYRPRWSLEIEEVGAFALDALPPDLAAFSRSALERHLNLPGSNA
jgi:ADP-ribose pyrophosphatase YjhB (NUDIX family)